MLLFWGVLAVAAAFGAYLGWMSGEHREIKAWVEPALGATMVLAGTWQLIDARHFPQRRTRIRLMGIGFVLIGVSWLFTDVGVRMALGGAAMLCFLTGALSRRNRAVPTYTP
jgi:hypothetical protein